MKLSRHPSRWAGRDLHIITQEAEAGDISDGGKFLTVFCTPRYNDTPPDDDITPLRTIINIPWKSPAQEATAIKSAIITVSLKVNRLDSFDPGPQADLWYLLLPSCGGRIFW